jgi:sugar phosphate isomerase/epimerase
LQSTVAAGAGLALGGPAATAIEPIRRTGKPHMRLSLAAYSYRKYLDLKKPTMTLDDFVELAAEMNLDAVEPTSYYFADTSPEYMGRLKARCTRLGLDISGTAVGNNFCIADDAKRKEQIEAVKKWVERASILGAKTIRIFAGTVAKDDSLEAAQKRCIAAMEEACDYAGKYGVILALENHGGITATAEQLLTLVKAVQSPWFGVNLDTGNFHGPDPYAELAQIAPYAVVAQVKTEISRTGGKKEDADLKRLIGILKDVNYRGYVALEYEGAEEPKTAVPRHVEELRKLIG